MRDPSATGLYILDDAGEPTPADALTWARWFESADRVVAQTPIGQPPRWYVSTVFIGVDYSALFAGGPPLLWESIVFLAEADGADMRGEHVERYASHADAAAGHAQLVEDWTAKLSSPARDRVDYFSPLEVRARSVAD